MRALQKELEELKDNRQQERDRESARAREAEDELKSLRLHCERLQQECDNHPVGVRNGDLLLLLGWS